MNPDPKWAPRYWTPRLWKQSDGPNVCDFAASLLRISKGRMAGQPVIFRPWQQWWLSALYERRPDGRRRYKTAIKGVARKNGKSLELSALGLDKLFDEELGDEVYACAGDRQQARVIFGEARNQVLNSPALRQIAKVYRDAIEVPSTGSIFRVLSSDAKLQLGLYPSLLLFDELLVQRNSDLWDAMTTGFGDRVDPLAVGITTAGTRMSTLLRELYDYGLKVATGELDDESFGFWWWSAPDGCAKDDRDAWRMANPNLDEGLLPLDEMESQCRQKSESSFRCFRLNQWQELGGKGYMDMDAWAALAKQGVSVADKAPVVAAFDGSVNDDSTALMIQTLDGFFEVVGLWEDDGSGDWQVPRDEVQEAVEVMFKRYKILTFWCDPSYWFSEVGAWEKAWGSKVVRNPNTNARIAPAAGQLYADVMSGAVSHNGDPRLTRYMGNAISRETAHGVTVAKADDSLKIDLVLTAIMCNDARIREINKKSKDRTLRTRGSYASRKGIS